jgi:hypothetical protein
VQDGASPFLRLLLRVGGEHIRPALNDDLEDHKPLATALLAGYDWSQLHASDLLQSNGSLCGGSSFFICMKQKEMRE